MVAILGQIASNSVLIPSTGVLQTKTPFVTTGKKDPNWLTVDWILSQFSKNRIEVQKKYREFVLDALDMSESPFEKVVGQLILGGKSFVGSFDSKLIDKSEIKEFTRQQRLIGRPSLEELVAAKQDKTIRNKAIKVAHVDYGYTLKEIADHLGRHYSSIIFVSSCVSWQYLTSCVKRLVTAFTSSSTERVDFLLLSFFARFTAENSVSPSRILGK